MKLWEAILIGCDRRAQAFGALFRKTDDGGYASCALGAAYEAVFNSVGPDLLWGARGKKLRAAFPVLNRVNSNGVDVLKSVVELNDWDHWPREKIALEFVKPLEDAENDTNQTLS